MRTDAGFGRFWGVAFHCDFNYIHGYGCERSAISEALPPFNGSFPAMNQCGGRKRESPLPTECEMRVALGCRVALSCSATHASGGFSDSWNLDAMLHEK